MIPEDAASAELDLQLYEHWDDEQDLLLKGPLNALIHGNQSALEAATDLDRIVRDLTSKRLQKLIDYVESHTLGPDDYQHGVSWDDLLDPSAHAYASQIIGHCARVSTAFSPYSEGQDRLVRFLLSLKSLPRWMAPNSRPDQNGEILEVEFWALEHGWLGLEDEFRRYEGNVDPRYSCNVGTHSRWRNLQHTMARLTAENLINCAPFNALEELVPKKRYKPNIKRHPEWRIAAAAQWLIWPAECRYVYEECLKKETVGNYRDMWSMKQWDQWKSEFVHVVEQSLYDEQTKSVARKVLTRMKYVEYQHSGGHEGGLGSSSGSGSAGSFSPDDKLKKPSQTQNGS